MILSEAKTPTFSRGNTFTIVFKKIDTAVNILKDLLTHIQNNREYISEDFYRGIGEGFVDGAEWIYKKLFTESESYGSLIYEITYAKNLLETAKTTPDPRFANKIVTEYLPTDIHRIIQKLNPKKDNYKLSELIHEMVFFIENSENWGFDEREINFVKNMLETSDSFVKILEDVDGYLDRMTTFSEWIYGDAMKGRSFRPKDLEDEEIAYHATINVREIIRDGFLPSYEGRKRGLGGGSFLGHISFTLDLKIAQTIMIAFKHIWMIANGKWSYDKVIDYVKRYSKNPKVDGAGTVYDFDKIVDIFRRNRGKTLPLTNELDLVEFYVTALWFLNTPVNRNPVFGSSFDEERINTFKSIDFKDIGIIKAKIKTTHASEFLVPEREIRIPPYDVLEMISIIQ